MIETEHCLLGLVVSRAWAQNDGRAVYQSMIGGLAQFKVVTASHRRQRFRTLRCVMVNAILLSPYVMVY